MTATETGVDASPQWPPAGHDGPGSRLKSAREAAGLSLDQVAQQLKLAPRQVRALEDEDFAQLPGRTFARGFVRNYARLLNLDGDDLLSLLPDAAHAPALEAPALQPTGAMIAELPTASTPKTNFTRWLIPLVLVGCIIGAAAYEWYRGGLSPQGDASRSAPPEPLHAAPAPTSGKELPNPLATDRPASEAAPASMLRDGSAEVPAASVAASPPASPASAAAAVPAAPLLLGYRGPSWTEIRDRDGQVLIARLVAAGSEQAIRGAPPFDIVIGNAHEVTLVYRGTPVDLSRYTRQNVARLRLP
ncbi:MAG TPA: helix-turn-helix domain-containing protein [Casimicrobiaceae bacterium]